MYSQILFPSLRNTVDAQLSLFEKLNCKVLITCPSLAQPLKSLLSAPRKFRKVQAPSLDDLLAEEPVPHYSYDQTFESTSNKPFLFMHTSGSSGTSIVDILSAHTDEQARKPEANCVEHDFHKLSGLLRSSSRWPRRFVDESFHEASKQPGSASVFPCKSCE